MNEFLKIKRLTAIVFALSALIFASCDKQEMAGDGPGGRDDRSELRFDICFAPQGAAITGTGADGSGGRIQTRAATAGDFTTTWENGDEIGLFAVSRTQGSTGADAQLKSSGNYIHNVKLTYNSSGGGTWTPSQDLYFDGDKVLDFYAYYPYDDNGGNPAGLNPLAIAFNVKADQSGDTGGKSNYNLSDLLTAKADNGGNGYGKAAFRNTPIPLTFTHALSLVQVEFKKDHASNIGPAGPVKVTLRTLKGGAALDLGASAGPVVSASGDAQSITMYCIENPADAGSYLYRALVPAQAVAADANLFTIEQFNELYGHKASAATLTAGNAKRYEIDRIPFMPTVEIKKGDFQMGSPDSEPNRNGDEKQHQVTLTKDFQMGKYTVTNAQYAAFLNDKGVGSDGKYDTSGDGEPTLIVSHSWGVQYNGGKWQAASGKAGFPVINVTWYGADEFTRWIGGSLPTEAQWEYACRAGTTTPFAVGDGNSLYADQANFDGNYPYDVAQGGHIDNYDGSAGHPNTYLASTTSVGSYTPNKWGLYDMHGNVYEWCSDWYNGSYYNTSPGTDPTGPTSGSDRVLRGGGWSNDAQYCRSAFRNGINPDFAGFSVGFRVVFVP